MEKRFGLLDQSETAFPQEFQERMPLVITRITFPPDLRNFGFIDIEHHKNPADEFLVLVVGFPQLPNCKGKARLRNVSHGIFLRCNRQKEFRNVSPSGACRTQLNKFPSVRKHLQKQAKFLPVTRTHRDSSQKFEHRHQTRKIIGKKSFSAANESLVRRSDEEDRREEIAPWRRPGGIELEKESSHAPRGEGRGIEPATSQIPRHLPFFACPRRKGNGKRFFDKRRTILRIQFEN
ncbi:MAG: hypothetical protein D6679_10120 [Candidatus Hydrogenedentota bacterium]|nr:MAG: hypothetical protein D6679_10120 [Candidatus Hydrogenedentota bacterium]